MGRMRLNAASIYVRSDSYPSLSMLAVDPVSARVYTERSQDILTSQTYGYRHRVAGAWIH